MTALPTTERAPAKVNLCLHVTGRRADGYHLLDSLVVFTELGDTVAVHAADGASLTIDGPQAAGLEPGETNLVLRAIRLMGGGASACLTKHLPVASGIGGGSADAAATLRAMARLTGRGLPADGGLGLGSDVPVCLALRPARMQGAGETLTLLDTMPRLSLVLCNPDVPLATAAVFGALRDAENPALPDLPAGFSDAPAVVGYLSRTRNDLEPPAIRIAPVIGSTLAALRDQPGCLLARMSGSGATCFAVFGDDAQAARAAQAIGQQNPSWWVQATATLD